MYAKYALYWYLCNVQYRVRIMVLVYVYQVIIEGGHLDC